jgi:hypothetical protein
MCIINWLFCVMETEYGGCEVEIKSFGSDPH